MLRLRYRDTSSSWREQSPHLRIIRDSRSPYRRARDSLYCSIDHWRPARLDRTRKWRCNFRKRCYYGRNHQKGFGTAGSTSWTWLRWSRLCCSARSIPDGIVKRIHCRIPLVFGSFILNVFECHKYFFLYNYVCLTPYRLSFKTHNSMFEKSSFTKPKSSWILRCLLLWCFFCLFAKYV